MADARASNSFVQWVLQQSPAERSSITSMLQGLNRYGLARKDPALIWLVQDLLLTGRHAIRINVFVMPERISVAVGRTRTMWFGVVEVAASSAPVVGLVGRLLVLKAWTADPGLVLVAVETELIALAQIEYP